MTTFANQSLEPDGFGSVRGTQDLDPDFTAMFSSVMSDVDGVRLHAVVGGTGSPVVLLGGWPQFWWTWRRIMPALAEHHTVIAVDPRGVGLSDQPDNGYDTGTVGAEVHGLIRALGHEKFALVGHDVGMWIGYAMAADDPDPITHLVLIDAALPGISDPPGGLPLTQREAEFAFHFNFNRLASLNEELVSGRELPFLAAQFQTKTATPGAIDDAALSVYVRAQQRPGALRGSFAYYRALDATIAQNQKRAERQIQMPVLAIGGEASRGELVEQDVRKVARDVEGSSLAGVGHYVPEEAPGALLELLDRHLRVPSHA